MAQNKNLLKVAIITMSLVQMGTNGIAPILAQISAAFPDASDTTIQFLMTFPSIFCLVFTIVSALLSDRLPKKTLAVTGLLIICLTGIAACLLHGSLVILYVWAAFLGIGIGMVAPLAPALVNECFTGLEKQTMLGWQNSANNVGSMLMTFLGGFLALGGWHFGYLVYLLGIPGVIFAILAVPGKTRIPEASNTSVTVDFSAFANSSASANPSVHANSSASANPSVHANSSASANPSVHANSSASANPSAHVNSSSTISGVSSTINSRGRFRLVILKEMIITALFLFVYSAAPANLAMLVAERQLGDTSYAGTISTMFLLGGMLSGLVFGLIFSKLKRWTSMTGNLLLAVGACIIGFSHSTVLLVIGCLIAGTSISMVLPINMGAASRLKGYETLNSAIILSSSFVGVFLAPLITNIAAAVTGSDDTSYRFFTIAVIAVIIAALSIVFKLGKQQNS